MTIKKLSIGVFAAAYLLGCFAFLIYVSDDKSKQSLVKNNLSKTAFTSEKPETEVDAKLMNFCCYRDNFAETVSAEEYQPEPNFDNEEESEPYTIDMLNIGEFHGDEVEAKSGEKWLALFNDNGKSHLEWTKIKVTTVRDEIADGKKGEITGKKVSIKSQFDPIFMLKNASTLKAGKVITLFDSRILSEQQYEIGNLHNGFKKDFILNGTTFTLKVVNENSTEEYISNGTKLILASGDVEQIVYPTEGERVGEFWYLLWAGDLDGDGKLDFYADVSDHYNSSMPTLFLSSEAKKGKFVKEVAGIRTVGC